MGGTILVSLFYKKRIKSDFVYFCVVTILNGGRVFGIFIIFDSLGLLNLREIESQQFTNTFDFLYIRRVGMDI